MQACAHHVEGIRDDDERRGEAADCVRRVVRLASEARIDGLPARWYAPKTSPMQMARQTAMTISRRRLRERGSIIFMAEDSDRRMAVGGWR